MQKFIDYAVNILYEEYTEGNPVILKFMRERNYTMKELEAFNIGYIRPNNRVPKFMVDNIEYYKEIKLLDHNNDITVKNRVVVPIKNVDGEFCMISCRITGKSDQAKYKTIKDNEVDRNAVLDGFYDNKESILSENQVFVTEGQFDYRTLWKYGVHNSVAVSGSRFSEEHLKAIHGLSERIEIIFATDNDTAGRKLIWDFVISHIDLWHKLYFIDWDEKAKDPDEYINKFGIERFLSLIKPIKHFVNYDIMTTNEKAVFIIGLRKNCKKVSDIFKYYDFVNANYSEFAESFYVSLLQKRIKTFENAGEFLYYASHRKKREHWFIERLIALWFLIGLKNKRGRYERFEIDLQKYREGSSIAEFDKIDELIELGEIYEYETETGFEYRSDYTNKLIKHCGQQYLRRMVKWEKRDQES